jgi:uncharacterized OsmC-like protein
MNVEKFRSAQAAYKQRYATDANAAMLTLRTQGALDDYTVTCRVDTGRGLATAGIHPNAGGSGQELCSGDMLLESIAACAGVSLKAAASVLQIPLRSARVFVEGDVDLRGTLGVADDVPVGFQSIRLRFELDADLPAAQRTELMNLVERYCVIVQTLKRSPRISVRLDEAAPRAQAAG